MSHSTTLTLPSAPRVLNGCEKQGYEALTEEASYWIDGATISGAIPDGLEGTLFRNGPGRNRIGTQQYGHWFDGDGMISAVTFKNGRVHFKNRYVRTPKYVRETEAQRILYRGVGTQIPGGILKNAFRSPGNAANTSVVLHAGKLLALWEGGKPWELDPATLETVGVLDFDGALGPMQPFSAHGKYDPRSGCYYNFGLFGIPKPKLHCYRIDKEGTLVEKKSQYVGDYSMCHDFAITDKYAVFVLCPAFMDSPFQFLFGMKSLLESIRYDPGQTTRVVVLSLDTFEIVRQFELDAFFGFHLGNAHGSGDRISVDVLCADTMDVMGGLADVFKPRENFDFQEAGAKLYRFDLNLATGELDKQPVANAVAGEFPMWNWRYTGSEHRYTYLATIFENGTPWDFNALQKIDHASGRVIAHDFGPGRFTSEACFVAAPNAADEDDGYLVSIVYNADRKKSEVVIVDARELQDEIAVIPLHHHLPFGFHGNFYHQTFE
ncbi:MAG: carotenoid oxygenase family protein [Pseudomonadales bacterium]|nr:carotenoid oxygenase family protein [Pseudomonadales bacterium]